MPNFTAVIRNSFSRPERVLLPIALLGSTLLGCKRVQPPIHMPAPLQQEQVLYQERSLIMNNGVYFGAFLDDSPSLDYITRFNRSIDGNLDMVLQFHAFAKGFDYPAGQIAELHGRGITSLIKLEPWSWEGSADISFSLGRIIGGEFDEGLDKFARGIATSNIPVLLTFGHEMNGDWYPWSGDPETYKKAYVHVWDIFERAGANKYATWLWNINAGRGDASAYYPGDKYVDGIGLDGYSTDWTGNPKDARSLFGADIAYMKQAHPLKSLWILEAGYDKSNGGSPAGEAQFLKSLVELAAQEELAGVFYFNVNKPETGRERIWTLTGNGTGSLSGEFKRLHEAFSTRPSFSNLGEIQTKDEADLNNAPAAEGKSVEELFPASGAFGGAKLKMEDKAIEISAPKGNYDAGGYFVLDKAVYGTLTFNAAEIYGESMILFINDTAGTDEVLADFRILNPGTVSLKIPEGATKICIHPALSGILRLENFGFTR